MFQGAPVINFNGEFMVDSLVIGSVLVGNRKVPAAQITILQVNPYPVLASQDKYLEVLAYCTVARRHNIQRINVYTPCVVLRSDSKQVTPLITHITWYVPREMHEQGQRELKRLKERNTGGLARAFPYAENAFVEIASWQR